MTDQEKIAALAAELERVGRMPEAWTLIIGGKGMYHRIEDEEGEPLVWGNTSVLAALSGVAAKIRAEHGLCIVKSGDKGEWDEAGEHIVYTSWVWELFDYGWENGSTLIEQYPSYEEAEIAAMKQIESEVKK